MYSIRLRWLVPPPSSWTLLSPYGTRPVGRVARRSAGSSPGRAPSARSHNGAERRFGASVEQGNGSLGWTRTRRRDHPWGHCTAYTKNRSGSFYRPTPGALCRDVRRGGTSLTGGYRCQHVLLGRRDRREQRRSVESRTRPSTNSSRYCLAGAGFRYHTGAGLQP